MAHFIRVGDRVRKCIGYIGESPPNLYFGKVGTVVKIVGDDDIKANCPEYDYICNHPRVCPFHSGWYVVDLDGHDRVVCCNCGLIRVLPDAEIQQTNSREPEPELVTVDG